MIKAKHREAVRRRLLAKVKLEHVSAVPNIDRLGPCWIWTGFVIKEKGGQGGYGQAWDGERVTYAHRISFLLYNGDLPPGMEPDHLCRVRRCISPLHLEAVTRRENLLRGNTIIAAKVAQTHCVRGHEFTPENTKRNRNGTRRCRACIKITAREWSEKNPGRRRALNRAAYLRKLKRKPQ